MKLDRTSSRNSVRVLKWILIELTVARDILFVNFTSSGCSVWGDAIERAVSSGMKCSRVKSNIARSFSQERCDYSRKWIKIELTVAVLALIKISFTEIKRFSEGSERLKWNKVNNLTVVEHVFPFSFLIVIYSFDLWFFPGTYYFALY